MDFKIMWYVYSEVVKTNNLIKIRTLHYSGIHLNNNWILHPLPLQHVRIYHWHDFKFVGTLQCILHWPGVAQCDDIHPRHLDFKKQENER